MANFERRKSLVLFLYSDLLEQFLVHCEVKNLTDETISSYRVKGGVFGKWCNNMQLNCINIHIIEKYILHLKKDTTSNENSINTYLRAVRAILYYGMDLGLVERFKIPLIKATKNVKATYSETDIEALVKPQAFKSITEVKVWAFECFLLATGVRLSTATNIRLADIDRVSKSVLLAHTKNRRQQIIPLTDSILSILDKYLDLYGRYEYLFPNTSGGRMDRRTIEQQVSSYNKRRGVQITSVHAFRHTYAKLSVLNGVDVFRLQKLMGHSTISVTKEYVELWGDDLRTNWCPLDNFS